MNIPNIVVACPYCDSENWEKLEDFETRIVFECYDCKEKYFLVVYILKEKEFLKPS